MARQPRSAEAGKTLIEAAIALPLFFVATVVTFDLLRITYSHLTLQFVAADVLRRAVVGPPGGVFSPQFRPQIENEVVQSAAGFGVQITPEEVFICDAKQLDANFHCADETTGEVYHFVSIGVDVPIDGFMLGRLFGLALGSYRITTHVVGMNEPFR